MRLQHRHYATLLIASLVAGACGDSTSPPDRSLDGAWTTGHAISGLEMGFNLAWAGDLIAGSGNYVSFVTTDACSGPALGLMEFGGARITAKRHAKTVTGTLAFDTGLRAQFSATVEGNGGIGTTMIGSFVAPDGTSCPWG